MAAVEYLNRPIESSKDLILKEAFKLFLQKNVEKVTVPVGTGYKTTAWSYFLSL